MNWLLLIEIAALLIFITLYLFKSKVIGALTRLRIAYLQTLLILSGLIFAFNEIVSPFNLINLKTALAFWITVIILSGFFLYYQVGIKKVHFERPWVHKRWIKWSLHKEEKIILALGMVLFMIPLFLLATFIPPNNFDAHSYHLNRIIIWIGNGNLENYATRHVHQLYLNVFAEYIVLHFFMLAGSDQFVGLVQFGSYIGCIFSAGLLAKTLGGNKRIQIIASVFALTLPIAIFESTSAQVDMIACFFFISFVYFGYETLKQLSAGNVTAMIFALALGGFSKYTILMFAIPFVIYFGIQFIKIHKITHSFKILVFSIVVFAIIYTPFFARNFKFFGNILGPQAGTILFEEQLPVDQYSLTSTFSNTIKNMSLHMGLPIAGYNQWMERLIVELHGFIGMDVNNPKITLDPFSVRYSVQEDMIPNTLQLGIMLLAFCGLFFGKTTHKIKWFAFLSVTGIIIFSTLMKYQLWSTRTHMPFFILGLVVASFIIEGWLGNRYHWLMIFVMATSAPFVFSNPNKPIMPIQYYLRYIQNRVPLALCPTNEKQKNEIQLLLNNYYKDENIYHCFELKENIKSSDQKEIFMILDSIGYFDAEKSNTIFTLSKDELYFRSHPADYRSFKTILEVLKNKKENIGVLFRGNYGYYHYWAAIQGESNSVNQMKYIGYFGNYRTLENSKKKFCYSYILGDDLTLLGQFQNENKIDTIYTTDKFYLAKLKEQSCKVIVIPSPNSAHHETK